jgi:hypothetical protein
MKKVLLIALVVLFAMGVAMAQYVPSTDVLGAHQNNGRGCAGCHTPHSGARGSGNASSTTGTDSGDVALWGQDVSVLYKKVLQFGDKPSYGIGFQVTLPGDMSGGIDDAMTGGVLMCLSCHDGSYTKQNMMANQSYEQVIGALPAVYGSSPIPTLLGDETAYGGAFRDYNNDHPIGPEAQITADAESCGTGPTCSGLVFSPNAYGPGVAGLGVTPGTPYAQFVQNYGWPALAPGEWSNPYGTGTNSKGKLGAFVVCTTCHDQHLMNVYTSTPAGSVNPVTGKAYGSPIANDGGGVHYRTFFFVRGPYNVAANTAYKGGGQAGSTTQFCRQCHFGESNEANGALSIGTLF